MSERGLDRLLDDCLGSDAMEQLRGSLAAAAANESAGDGVVCPHCLNGVHEECHGEPCLCACSGVWKAGDV